MKISVLIPVLNEAPALRGLIPLLAAQPLLDEILLADSGSTDGSAALARDAGWRVITSAKGRGIQLEAARRAAQGEILWMLHADTRPPQDAAVWLTRAFADPAVEATAFRLAYEGGGWPMACVAWGGNLRSRLRGRPYGDQGIALRARTLEELGGLPPWSFLEDLWLVDQLRREGRRLRLLGPKIRTSPRRFLEEGIWHTLWQHQRILQHYARHGAPPAGLR